MRVIQKAEDFEIRHKIISFTLILIVTIVITRTIVSLGDPNVIIKGFEIHHFYYGLIILIITNLLLLYRRIHFKLALVLSAISIGLIIDELFFIGEKVRGNLTYSATVLPTITLAIIVILVLELIFHFKSKRGK